MIWAILLEDSPCCGVPHPVRVLCSNSPEDPGTPRVLKQANATAGPAPQIRGDQGRCVGGKSIEPQSEVIRAVALEDSPC